MKYTFVAAALTAAVMADDWESWSSTTAPVDPTTTWTNWDPKPTTTWSNWVNPTSKSTTWSDWDPATSSTTWANWVNPTTSPTTWGTWQTVSTPVVQTSGKCSYTTVVTKTKCDKVTTTKCWAEPETKTLYADQCTWNNVNILTSTVKAAWTGKDNWFGPSWSTATVSGSCPTNTVTSYGYPIWNPVPTMTKAATATWSPVAAPPAPAPPKPQGPVACTGSGCAPIKPNGNKWSMTYSPYDASGKCKTVDVITADIKKISDLGFVSVRVYSTDCNTLQYVGAACAQYNLKIILGVFIASTGIEAAKTQVTDIKAWAKWELVEIIVIGNEAVFQGFCTSDELVAFITWSKAQFAAAGYTGYCTTTEPLAQWQQYGSAFCGVVDVVSANLYAFFNDQCEASNAGVFISEQITILEQICVGKSVYVMESGWPTEGQCNGKACPGVQQQITAITSIQQQCGAQIVFFSFEDDLWKQPGQYGVEQHWGCADVFASNSWSALPAKPTSAKPSTTWANVVVPTTTKKADPTGWESYP